MCKTLFLPVFHQFLREGVIRMNSIKEELMTIAGKGVEDKRGQSVSGGISERCWLYLCGHAVVCNRQMEVAAMVSGINPAINTTMDSVEMGSLQQVKYTKQISAS